MEFRKLLEVDKQELESEQVERRFAPHIRNRDETVQNAASDVKLIPQTNHQISPGDFVEWIENENFKPDREKCNHGHCTNAISNA